VSSVPRIHLGGEGKTELGSLAGDPAYHPLEGEAAEQGVLESLLRRVREDVEIAGATEWKRIRKFRSGAHATAEIRNVLGLCLHAKERGATLVAFARDRDRDVDRERAVAEGIRRAANVFPELHVVGGVAVEAVEAWALSMLADARAATYARPKEQLSATHAVTSVAQLAEICADPERAPCERDSGLVAWLDRAAHALRR
jgi:hypothetical protein